MATSFVAFGYDGQKSCDKGLKASGQGLQVQTHGVGSSHKTDRNHCCLHPWSCPQTSCHKPGTSSRAIPEPHSYFTPSRAGNLQPEKAWTLLSRLRVRGPGLRRRHKASQLEGRPGRINSYKGLNNNNIHNNNNNNNIHIYICMNI